LKEIAPWVVIVIQLLGWAHFNFSYSMDARDEHKDEEVAARVQKGDVEAFQILVERYDQKMSRYARRFLFDSDEAKDLVQDIFIKAYVNIQGFDIERRFSPWIYRIAHNEFVNALKKKKNERANLSLFDFDVLFPHLQLTAKETADSDINRRELKEVLDGSLDKIPQKYKESLILYYFEDMDYKEIADVLHVPVSTVGIRLQRGKLMLKKMIKK
jgi:RNA polymerase sigma-70 factor (ECF subfamily)